MDPKLASYGVENPLYAVIQLAQTTMRSELGKISLDKTFEERDTLNDKIVVSFLIEFYDQKIIGVGLLHFHCEVCNYDMLIVLAPRFPCSWPLMMLQKTGD